MVAGHRIEKIEDVESFLERIETYKKEDIECTSHTFFRLNEKQREFFKCEDIKRLLLGERPVLVGLQYNGCFAVFYKHEKQRYIRLIIDVKPHKIEVVTFYILESHQIPQIRK